MSAVSGGDTKPELIVRRLVHGMGFRYRLHVAGLPGKPDMVLSRHRKVIFIHGCFWHGHEGCKRAGRPASNIEFWNAKIDKNLERDRRSPAELERLGWKILVVWECETKNIAKLTEILSNFLNGP
jgi:DNA mismatch endonuclease (patch repair protein)